MKKTITTRCQCVYKDATAIGCGEDHMFCKGCLNEYFKDRTNTRCPSCRQGGLSTSTMKASKFADRIIRNARVKCELEYQQDNDNNHRCEWTGELSALSNHINHECSLFHMECEHCHTKMKRYEMKEHDKVCPEVPMQCELGCSTVELVKRKRMKYHITKECPMTLLSCSECKENVIRKDMMDHKQKLCPDILIHCPFKEYGCNITFKRKALQSHLTESEGQHLKLKVKTDFLFAILVFNLGFFVLR